LIVANLLELFAYACPIIAVANKIQSSAEFDRFFSSKKTQIMEYILEVRFEVSFYA
jgi:hypothetical protein